MTQLQIAVDGVEMEGALALAAALHDVVDIFEVGTPLILRSGLETVRRLKDRYPGMTVLADTKIADGGKIECGDACRAGADIVTVLAFADDAVVRGVIDMAHACGRKAMADLIHVRDIESRAAHMLELGADYVCVHTAYDLQAEGRTPLSELECLSRILPGERLAVAGGIRNETIDSYLALRPGIVIMGSALYGAEDPRAAALGARGHIDTANE